MTFSSKYQIIINGNLVLLSPKTNISSCKYAFQYVYN